MCRPSPLPTQHLLGLLATHFAAVFCGLDYLVCGTSIAGEAAGDFILIFAVSRLLNFRLSAVVLVVVSAPQSFLIKNKLSLKPSVARLNVLIRSVHKKS